MDEKDISKENDANRDPITGAPGAHPVGTGLGAAAGGMAAGAAVGTVAGPVGTTIGAAVGAVAGGLLGKGVAEKIDPTIEEDYWRENYRSRPYASDSESFEDIAPAYRHGWESYSRYGEKKTFDEAEPDLQREWEAKGGNRNVKWERARYATKDAWERVSDKVERAVPGDSDRDGR